MNFQLTVLFVSFFVIIAVNTAKSQQVGGVKRERPVDLPRSSTKKGKRPPRIPFRANNPFQNRWGPPRPPSPPRNPFNFNYFERRKEPFIPVELHPPILERPKPENTARQRPRSRPADRPKPRRQPTTTIPTTEFQTTELLTTVLPEREPPTTKATIQTTVKQAPVVKTTPLNKVPSTTIPKVNNVQTSNQNLSVGQKVPSVVASSPVSNIDIAAPGGQPVNNVPYRPIITGSIFGQNKIPRPPPLPPKFQGQSNNVAPIPTKQSQPKKSTNMIQPKAAGSLKRYQSKHVTEPRNLFKVQKGQSAFRRPSDIPSGIKPQLISYISTGQMNRPQPSSPEIFSKGNKAPSVSIENDRQTDRNNVPPSQPFAMKPSPPANPAQFGQKKDISYSIAFTNPTGTNPNLIGLESRPGQNPGKNNFIRTDMASNVPVKSSLGINKAPATAFQNQKPVPKFDRTRVAQQIVGPNLSGGGQSLAIPLSQQTSNQRSLPVVDTRSLSSNTKMSSMDNLQLQKPALEQLTNTEFSQSVSIGQFSSGQRKQNARPLKPTSFIPKTIESSWKNQQLEFFATGTYASQVLPSSDPSIPVLQQRTQSMYAEPLKKGTVQGKGSNVMRAGSTSKQSFRKASVVGTSGLSSQAVQRQTISTSVEPNNKGLSTMGNFGGRRSSVAMNEVSPKQSARQSENTGKSVLSSQVVPQETQLAYGLTFGKDVSSAGALGVRGSGLAIAGPSKKVASQFTASENLDRSRQAVQQQTQSQTHIISPNKGLSSRDTIAVRYSGPVSNGSPAKQSLAAGTSDLSRSTGKQQIMSETHILSSNKGKPAKNTLGIRSSGSGSVVPPPKQLARHSQAAWTADPSRQAVQKQPYSTLVASPGSGIPTTNTEKGMSSTLSKSVFPTKKSGGQTPGTRMSNFKSSQSGSRGNLALRQQAQTLRPGATSVKLASSTNRKFNTPHRMSMDQQAFKKHSHAGKSFVNQLSNPSIQQSKSLQSPSEVGMDTGSLSRSKPNNSQQTLNSAETLDKGTKLAQSSKATKQDRSIVNLAPSATKTLNDPKQSLKQTNTEQVQLAPARKNVNANSSNQPPMKPNMSTGKSTTNTSQSRLQKVGNLMLQAFNDFLSKFNGVSPIKGPISRKKPVTRVPAGNMASTKTKANTKSSFINTSKPTNDPLPKGAGMLASKSESSQSAVNREKNTIGVNRSVGRSGSGGKSKNVRIETKANVKKSVLQNVDGQTPSKKLGRKFGLVQSNKESKNANLGSNSVPTKDNKKFVDNSSAIKSQRQSNVVRAKPSNISQSSGKGSLEGTAKSKVTNIKRSRTINQNNINSKTKAKQTGIPSTEVIRGPPPPSFRRGKKPRAGKKGRRVNKPRRRVIEKEPPGFNVPPSAHPPVLTRPEGTGSVTKDKVLMKSVANGQDIAQNSVPTSQEQIAVRTNPVQASCSLSPVCGSDGFTYMSNCFLWEGLTVACHGYCPCATDPTGQPPMSQTSQQAVIKEPVPRSLGSQIEFSTCSCPAVYEPVCATSGTTFENDCARRCIGAQLACNGECPCASETATSAQPCENQCEAAFSPVCSVLDHTFDNDCLRQCSGEPKACDGECPCVVSSMPDMAPSPVYEGNGRSVEPSNQPLSTCECLPGDIDPVCTKSGETLWYGCEAICLGADVACTSACPC